MTFPVIDQIITKSTASGTDRPFLSSAANHFVIHLDNTGPYYDMISNNVSYGGYSDVLLRKGLYIGEKVTLEYKAYVANFENRPEDSLTFSHELIVSIQFDYDVDAGYPDRPAFIARSPTDIPYSTTGVGYNHNMHIRTVHKNRPTVVFLVWTGHDWLIENHTRFGIDPSNPPISEVMVPVRLY